MCRNVDVIWMEEEIDKDRYEIEKTHVQICVIRTEQIWYNINDKKLEVKNKCMSRNIFKEVIGSDESCRERSVAKVVDGPIM